ncbi:MAG TPA: DUF6516 family protein [Blastocatellia bacterium]|nr:DUF6516 family protein [Blastocatellia bacterium]HMV82666.1 DUF6516 family protein [Blastocatellia bacterium]HMY76754.1 DUF6516 family protein [Blastocatellia bacterium]HMZ16817.1 DUF6516 family protein [Blastocatellia bacterium]HNG32287.1 DUF6516 family protein [Blastocatellia bacterium]
MRDIIQYFDLLTTIIENSSTVSEEVEIEQLDSRRGTIDGVLYFSDGSRLEFTERVVIENAKPVKREYRYQYIKSQSPIFRYDNAPHHPQLAGFPHHKHIGRKTLDAKEPNLEQVIEEALSLITKADDSGQSVARKRRQARTRQTPTK